MERPFLIDEIMLEGVSGEVRGVVEVDLFSGSVQRIDCVEYDFRQDDTDRPVGLSASQVAAARAIVRRVLESNIELADFGSPLIASGEKFSPPRPAVSSGSSVLAGYLESPERPALPNVRPRRAQ